MKIIYVTANSIPDRLIRHFDGGEFSHCAMVFGDNVVQAIRQGVVVTPLKNLLDICTVTKTINVPLKDEEAAKSWAYHKVGASYDFLAVAILGWRDVFGVAPRWDSNGRFFCDELVLSACIAGGLQEPEQYPRFYGIKRSFEFLSMFATKG